MPRIYPSPKGNSKVKWISPEWLEQHIKDDMMIIDCQPNIHDYVQEHIEGAVYLNEEFLRTSFHGKPNIFSTKEVVEAVFRRVGVRNKTPVVVYTGVGPFKKWGDGLEQTMMTYGLSRYGHDEIYLLDGGIDRWKKEGRKLAREYPKVPEGDFKASVQDDHYIEYDEFRRIKDRSDVIVLDARPTAFYEGQGPWSKPGHIPGAVSLPWASLMTENKRELKSDDELIRLIEAAGATKDKTIITSCGTGREQTNEFLIFRYYLGYSKVRGYEGSFTEWTSYPENMTVIGSSPR